MQVDSDDKSVNQENRDHYDLPDHKTLQEADELEVQDADGKKHAFKTLHLGPDRQIIVFIRHFFCGHCEDYVRALSTSLPLTRLAALHPPTTLTIIGCGSPTQISPYKTRTTCPFPIYTDPTRALYAKLGMQRSLDLGPTQPSYVQSGIVAGTVKSMGNMIKAGMGGMRGGDYSQNGGEWVWEKGELRWGRRMRNTRDHAEVAEVERVVGLRRD